MAIRVVSVWFCRVSALALLLGPAGCSGDDSETGTCSADCSSSVPTAVVSGIAAPFNDAVEGRIEGATVSVLERPGTSMVTGADGRFSFDGIAVGGEVTLVLEHPKYPLIQTGTHTVPAEGIDDLTFQVPNKTTYDLLAGVVDITPDPTKCQLVTTITRKGGTILAPGAHGEGGVTVTSDPPIPSESGPIYFDTTVVPDRALTESSDDGGVLFTNVTPGVYVWSGHKAGAELGDVKLTCRAGVLVNASPPRGMNVL